eukprot:Phypoly_transcript_03128.p1 GENE.Phypoly_transcript_03128~~Phypoly_transcript_03128.p1  ORF type:complete len:830 (-),score=159.54 Phypoly_transcript_03128:70-2271(-)
MNKLQPGSIKTININQGSLASKENIGSFLRSCQAMGIDECRLFDITDLYDERNINQVVATLSLLQTVTARRRSADTHSPTPSPPLLRRIHSSKSSSDSSFLDLVGDPEELKKDKKKNKSKFGTLFLRRSSSSRSGFSPPSERRKSSTEPKLKKSLSEISSPKMNRHSVSIETLFSSSPSLSPPLSRVSSVDSVGEAAKLREDLARLFEDKRILKERVGFSYPEKYRSFAMFEEYIKKDADPTWTAPSGANEIDYLKSEEKKLLGDIFTLTSMLAIVEENRGLRIRMAELQKMVDAMMAEKKQVTSRVDELLVPAPTTPAEAETDGVLFSDWKGKTGEIKGGTAEKLVERLYTTSIAGSVSEYVDFFLLTYRSFITPNKVLEMLTQTFLTNRVPNETEDTETAAIQVQQEKLMRLRICNFLKRWVESYYEDFDEDLMTAFKGFIDACQEDRLVVLLKKTLEKKLGGGAPTQRQFTFDNLPPTPVLPRSTPLTFSQEDWEPIEIARQLTIIEYDMYREIAAKELLSLSWQKSDNKKRSPNLLRMIHRFNELNNWVQWQIVAEPNLKKRAATIKKMIKVTEELKKLGNFNAVFVFVSALHSASVNRLRKTWEEVPRSSIKQLEEYDALTSPNGSFMAYREELHNANPPCIPYVGVYLSDLTFIEEGNQDFLENGYINFFKRRMVAEVIKEIQQYQQAPYNLQIVPQLQKYLTNHTNISDNDLFQRSLISEPRETHS